MNVRNFELINMNFVVLHRLKPIQDKAAWLDSYPATYTTFVSYVTIVFSDIYNFISSF